MPAMSFNEVRPLNRRDVDLMIELRRWLDESIPAKLDDNDEGWWAGWNGDWPSVRRGWLFIDGYAEGQRDREAFEALAEGEEAMDAAAIEAA